MNLSDPQGVVSVSLSHALFFSALNDEFFAYLFHVCLRPIDAKLHEGRYLVSLLCHCFPSLGQYTINNYPLTMSRHVMYTLPRPLGHRLP